MNFVCSKAVCKVFFQRLLKNVLYPARRPFWPTPAFVFGGGSPPWAHVLYMPSAPGGRCTPREIPEKRKFSDFDSTDAPSGPPRYENSFGSVRICHCRSRLAVTPKARLLSPAAIFQETCFFWGEGGPPSPGAHVLYIIGERKTGVPTEKTATNNKVFGLRQFRCTITAVRVQKVPRYRSDFETHATSGCHTEGPICSVHVCFFSGPGGGAELLIF